MRPHPKKFQFSDDMTIAEAREVVLKNTKDGIGCPCCGKLARVYRRSISSTMAYYLIRIYRAGGDMDFVDTPLITKGDHAAEIARMVYWGLLEPKGERREDGGPAGWYRITERGSLFIRGVTRVQKYVHIYNDKVIERSGPMISITDALGHKFDYRELMEA